MNSLCIELGVVAGRQGRNRRLKWNSLVTQQAEIFTRYEISNHQKILRFPARVRKNAIMGA